MGGFCSCMDSVLTAIAPCFNSNTGAKIVPIENQPQIMDLRLCEVSIMSSHNSYIRTLQHLSESSTDAIKIVLDRGARCIELDIYREHESNAVFVAHGKEETPDDIITTTKLDLGAAFAFIQSYAFTKTNDPLFIAVELNVHNEEAACNNIADLLERHFGDRLYKGVLSGETRIGDLINKVVILSGGGSVGRLASMIHMNWNTIFQNFSSSVTPSTIRGVGTCIRVYPDGDLAGALSFNYNPIPFLLNGATFVALNMCMNDTHMKLYSEWFAHSSIVKKTVV